MLLLLTCYFFAETTFSTDPARLLLFGSMSPIVNPIRRKWVGSHLNVVAEHKRPPAVSVSHSHASENGSHFFYLDFPKSFVHFYCERTPTGSGQRTTTKMSEGETAFLTASVFKYWAHSDGRWLAPKLTCLAASF